VRLENSTTMMLVALLISMKSKMPIRTCNIKPMGGRPAFHEREQFQVPLIDLGQAVEEEDRPERNCGEVRKNQIEKFRITVAAATCFSGCSKS
jgi:hypothetical protein